MCRSSSYPCRWRFRPSLAIFPCRVAIALLVAAAAFRGQVGNAQALYWTGTGTWGSATNWGLASGGPYNTAAWINYSDANFEGVAGTVTVSGTQDFDGLVFTTTGYTLTGGTIQIGNPGSPYFYVATGDTATINSALARADPATRWSSADRVTPAR